jgi:quinol monooxygenase YgiN
MLIPKGSAIMNSEQRQTPIIIAIGHFIFSAPVNDDIRARFSTAQRIIAHERGCLDYRYSIDLIDPSRVSVVAHWTDSAVLEAHIANAHTKTFIEELLAVGMQSFTIKPFKAELLVNK